MYVFYVYSISRFEVSFAMYFGIFLEGFIKTFAGTPEIFSLISFAIVSLSNRIVL